jgi:hypothetical protein
MPSNYRAKCNCGFEYLHRDPDVVEVMAQAHVKQPTRMDDSVRASHGAHSWKITEEPIK